MPPVLDLEAPVSPASTDAAPAQPPAGPRGLGLGDAVALPFLFVALLVGIRIPAGMVTDALGWGRAGLLPLLLAQLVAGPIVLALGVRWSGLPLRAAFTLRRFPLRILPAVLVASVALMSLAGQLTLLLPNTRLYRERAAEGFAASAPLVALISAVVAAPILEELLCRGVLLRGLLRRHSAWTAGVVTAIVFALFHLNATQGMVALPLGLGVAWLALRTGSVVPGIVSHAAVNSSTVLTGIFLLRHGYTARQLAGMGHATLWTMGAAAALALLSGFVLWWQLRDYTPAGDAAAAAPRLAPFDAGASILRPAFTIGLAIVVLFVVPRQLRTFSVSPLLVPESGPPAPGVVAAAGCYALDLPSAVAARLFPGAGPAPVQLRLSTTRYRVGIEHPSRYLVQPLQGAAPLRAPGDTAPVYWIARDGGGVSIVAGPSLLVLRPAGTALAGTVARYDSATGAAAAPLPASARRIPCTGEAPSGR